MVNMGNDAEISNMRCVHRVTLVQNGKLCSVVRVKIRAQQDNRNRVEEKEIQGWRTGGTDPF